MRRSLSAALVALVFTLATGHLNASDAGEREVRSYISKGSVIMRDPSNSERLLIVKLISFMRDDIDHYLAQVSKIMVSPIDEFGSFSIHVDNQSGNGAASKPLVSAIQADLDSDEVSGPFINLILFGSEGRLTELQIYKDGETTMFAKLDPDKLRIY